MHFYLINIFFIFHHSSHENDLNHIITITKKSLNKLCSSHLVGVQEAVHEIAGLDLVICSYYLTDVSLGWALLYATTQKKSHKNKDLVSSYRNRDPSFDYLSFEQIFFKIFRKNEFYKDSKTNRKKDRILIPKGLNCQPRYPADYDYTKGMLIMHKPWSVWAPLTNLFQDEKRTIDTFLAMIGKWQLPLYILSEYNREV